MQTEAINKQKDCTIELTYKDRNGRKMKEKKQTDTGKRVIMFLCTQ